MDKPQHQWDREAATLDEEPDHGLRDPIVRQAWMDLLEELLPPLATGTSALDIGCGTGSLSLVLGELGYSVTGIDFSAEMLTIARNKALKANLPITFEQQDANDLLLLDTEFDVILCRHVLWSLPEPAHTLVQWERLLKPGGQLVLIEGFWYTGVGLHAQTLAGMLPPVLERRNITQLSNRPALWGKPVNDERYVIVAHR
jgi:2-polyprenyl-3-methyl-5-hydroxy-6-metoxy-1,4-benzoquinol methylase